MRGLTPRYLLRRLAAFALTVWVGATLIFFIPRLMPGDPIGALIAQEARSGNMTSNSAAVIEAWRERFGLNDPLHIQYLDYLKDLARGDLGVSMRFFPVRVSDMIRAALPWTVGLLLIATVIAFIIGNAIGAALAWPSTPRGLKALLPLTLPFTAIPHFMIGIVLLSILVFQLHWFPGSGVYARGADPGLTWAFAKSVIYHGTLPALSIILSTMGFYALSMRGMMITTAGEDYMTLGVAKGLRPRRLFWRYGIRNAMLPQITDLTLSIGGIVGGTVLVEVLFSYRGIGYLLYQGLITNDFALINGIVFMLVVSTSFFVLLVDLAYPLLDPRISYASGSR